MRDKKAAYRVLVRRRDRKNHMEDLGVARRRYKTDLLKVGWKEWTGLIWLMIGTTGGRL
jgi:hypothetical protein